MTHALNCDELLHSDPEIPSCCAGEHNWTFQGCGGCASNPGCWSLGGTTLKFVSRCTKCGLGRTEIMFGRQRNPDQCDTITYEEGQFPIGEDL